MTGSHRRWPVAALLALSLAGSGYSLAQPADDPVPAPAKDPEPEVVYPAFPKPDSLLEFDAGAASGNRFLIDKTTLTVGPDRIIRYVLVIRSPNGVDNVSFEGMRCETRERRLYATGRADRTWSRSRNDKWMEISASTLSLPHMALARLYLCDQGIPIRTAKEGIEAIGRGGPRGWLN